MPSRDPSAVGLQRGKDLPHFVDRLNLAREVCRHDPIVCSIIPFAEIPPVLAEPGYREPSMSEIIGGEPANDIAENPAALINIGFAGTVAISR